MTIDECYRILGVSRNASQEEIKVAYLKLIRQWHPDISKNPEAKEKAKKINAAYEMLTKQGPIAVSPDNLWESFFGIRNPFNFNFDFNSKVIKSSVVLEIDESNSKNIDLIPEILRKAGFIVKSFTITRYH